MWLGPISQFRLQGTIGESEFSATMWHRWTKQVSVEVKWPASNSHPWSHLTSRGVFRSWNTYSTTVDKALLLSTWKWYSWRPVIIRYKFLKVLDYIDKSNVRWNKVEIMHIFCLFSIYFAYSPYFSLELHIFCLFCIFCVHISLFSALSLHDRTAYLRVLERTRSNHHTSMDPESCLNLMNMKGVNNHTGDYSNSGVGRIRISRVVSWHEALKKFFR